MASSIVRTVSYITDAGDEVQILIKYEDNGRAQDRLDDGGFDDENLAGCSSTVPRKRLFPRHIIKRYGTGQNATNQRVFVKELDEYLNLITESTTVRYCGECYCPNNPQ